MTNFILDTNILLRFCDPASSSHALARQSIAKLLAVGDQIYLTPQSLTEFWVVATRPPEANGLGWDTQKTRFEIEQLLDQFPLLVDTPAIFAHWLYLVTAQDIKGKKAHDARFVAIMQTHGITNLLTFNTDDFKSYSGIMLVHPSDVN